MKHVLLLIISLISICSCTQEKKENKIVSQKEDTANPIQVVPEKAIQIAFECPTFNFETNKVQADSIVRFFEKAKKLTGNEKLTFEKLFFCSFPDSFDNMEDIFGFDSETGKPATLYDYSGGPDGTNKGPMSYAIISSFGSLTSIPPENYYNKYINICVNGNWQADNIHQAFGIHKRFENDTKSICHILSKRNQKEIYSLFRFIFDGPHPDNEMNQEIFASIYPLIAKEKIELGTILKKAYDDLMKEKGKHGH